MLKRFNGRADNQVRPLTITHNFFEYADGSILLELGKTKVACAVTLTGKVPPFLKGKKEGWLTAEYAMLPAATQQRTEREASTGKRNGRSIEISRLIGRVFRSVVDLAALGERTITIDCEVLQADGSTRTACITAASLALKLAAERWVDQGIVRHSILKEEVAALSIGVKDGRLLLDIDYLEDSVIDADFNFVLTKSGNIIEIQGCAEKMPLPWHTLDAMRTMIQEGITVIFESVAHDPLLNSACLASAKKEPFNGIRFKERA